MKEVCTGFVAMNRKVLDDLDLDNAPSGMEFSSWFLMNTIGKKKHANYVGRNQGRLYL